MDGKKRVLPFENTSDEPVYNIRAVTQQTQIDPATLRAWERRYDIPKPKRDVQGHRLYSERDIMLLRWLKAQVDASVRIKQAVELLYMHAPQSLDEHVPVLFGLRPPSGTFDDEVIDFLDAVRHFDYNRAQHLISYMLSIQAVEEVCLNLLLPAIHQIGVEWEAGNLSLQMEHFASNLIRERLQAMLNGAPPPTRSGRLVVACAPLDWHELAALMLSLIVRRRGWEVIYLGQNVGLKGLDETLHSLQPQALTFSVSRLPGLRHLPEVANILEAATEGQAAFSFAGRIFQVLPELTNKMPGTYLGSDLLEAARIVEGLLARQRNAAASTAPEFSSSKRELLEVFLAHRARLEAAATGLILELTQGQEDTQTAQAAQEVMEVLLVALQYDDDGLATELTRWSRASLSSYGLSGATIAALVAHFGQEVRASLAPEYAQPLTGLVQNLYFEG
ncbi:MAG: MerR family transcriptional regulator [Anaerolineae bacterium]|nr:MerR family transcriptional regulator [Anaerolineae bacterium]